MSSAVDTREQTQKGSWALWARLRNAFGGAGPIGADDRPGAMPEPSSVPADDVASRRPQARAAYGKVLNFPIRGEALLVRLADLLGKRMAISGSGFEPLLLTISRGPTVMLAIDHAADVEFDPESALFCVTIEATLDTRVTLQTADFDTVVDFVVQYVADRRIAASPLMVAL
jgi:hypothetical protein